MAAKKAEQQQDSHGMRVPDDTREALIAQALDPDVSYEELELSVGKLHLLRTLFDDK